MEVTGDCSKIIFSQNLREDLLPVISLYGEGKVFVSTETRVDNLWVHGNLIFSAFPKIVVPAGEENKKLSSVTAIWEFLSQSGADRKSLLINVGGGMLTDLAGFAASTFKRGIDFINIPTTLLSQVDASVGGKTGINLNGLKNEIGTFRAPCAVLIHTPFLQTLDRFNFLSGFAEMIKHGLIYSTDHLEELTDFDFDNIDYGILQEYIRHSVEVKSHFVTSDPHEKNIRKALNFGHTIGHALESLSLEQGRPLLHGYAVAYGMMAELFLSVEECGFPNHEMDRINRWLTRLFDRFCFDPSDFERLMDLMKHDKKNEEQRINFTLLHAPGKYEINRECRKEQILDALKYLLTQ